MTPIRLLLVEDHASYRQAIEAVCQLEDDLVVVGHAARGDEAAEVAAACRPDVALVDLDLPGADGVAALRAIRASGQVACLVLTALTDDVVLGEAVEAGAAGVVHKSAEVGDLLDAVRAVASGANLLDPTLVTRWLQRLHETREGRWRSRVLSQALSPREHEVLRRLTAGQSVAVMAEDLGISVPTVETHLRNLRLKLGAESRLEAVITGLELGLVDPPGAYQ